MKTRTASSRGRYVQLYVTCPRCQVRIEAEVSVADGRVDVLRYDLCPNELGIDGHPLNSHRDLYAGAIDGLASAGLI